MLDITYIKLPLYMRCFVDYRGVSSKQSCWQFPLSRLCLSVCRRCKNARSLNMTPWLQKEENTLACFAECSDPKKGKKPNSVELAECWRNRHSGFNRDYLLLLHKTHKLSILCLNAEIRLKMHRRMLQGNCSMLYLCCIRLLYKENKQKWLKNRYW